MTEMKTKKLTQLALLSAVSLIIFIIELRIPNLIPIPGVKLGLANIVTVYAVYKYKPSEVWLIVLVRIVLGSIFSGSVVSLMYSLGGAICCLFGMLFIKKFIPVSHMWIASPCGAIFHNIGQIAVAVVVIRTFAIIVYLPALMVSGIVSGLLTGICAQLICNRQKNIPPT